MRLHRQARTTEQRPALTSGASCATGGRKHRTAQGRIVGARLALDEARQLVRILGAPGRPGHYLPLADERGIREYAENIWHVQPVPVKGVHG